MRKEFNTINIKDGLTGEVFVLHDIEKYSVYTVQEMLSDIVFPLLYDKGSVYISVGYKN